MSMAWPSPSLAAKPLRISATDGGIYRTIEGYSKLDTGTCGTTNGFDNLNASSVANGTIGSLTQFVAFSIHPTDQNTVLGGTQDNGSPATSSATDNPQWITVNGGDGGYNAINPASPDEWYTANTYVNIYSCANGMDCTTDAFPDGGERRGGRGHGRILYALHPRSAESSGNAGGDVPRLARRADRAGEFLHPDQR